MAKNKSPKHVLITRFSALGDVAIAIPVVYDVCRAWPDVNFYFVTRPWQATLLQNPPANLTVVPIDVRGKFGGVLGMAKLASHLRKQFPIDAMADLHSVIRTWQLELFMRLRGVAVQAIKKDRKARKRLVTGVERKQLTPTYERYRDVFARLGLPSDGTRFHTIFDGVEVPQSDIVPEKAEGQRWIAVSPFSSHTGKTYPLEQLIKVIEKLVEMPNVHVFLMGGGKAERTALMPIDALYDNVTSVAALKHDFIDELALLSRCDVMVSMDSANMHLAALVGLPVVSIWGATHRYAGFMGWHCDPALAVERTDLDCRPCSIYGERKCRHGDLRCLRGIEPQMIVDRIITALEPRS